MTVSYSAAEGHTTSFEKGEIVMRERDQLSMKEKEGVVVTLEDGTEDDCVFVNCEGNENRVPKPGLTYCDAKHGDQPFSTRQIRVDNKLLFLLIDTPFKSGT